jgi:AcrR family transcriptional regulator
MSMRSHTPKGARARRKILRAAEALVVTHGFHGTSMRDVAKRAELPLATVVYHFAKKEQLYAALLHEIGGELVTRLESTDDFVADLVAWVREQPGRAKLLVRELLDNPTRVRTATQLPLAPFLLRASARVGGEHPEIAVLHVVGALSYVAAAWPTVERIVGASRARRMHSDYEREALRFARSVLEKPHGPRTASTARAPRARSPRARDHG